MKINANEFIRYMYEQDRDLFTIVSDEYFINEGEGKLFLNKLTALNVITYKPNRYGEFTITKDNGLYKVAIDFKCDLEQYEKSLTRKDDLEIENLEYQARERVNNEAIRELTKKNLQLSTENLKLQNWDIKFRWIIAGGTFVAGFLFRILWMLLLKLWQ